MGRHSEASSLKNVRGNMKTLPHFPFYPADFLSKTGRLTDEQVGAYIRLLCEQWIAGDIPLVDANGDASALRMLSESIDRSWPAISKYFVVDGHGMKNERMEEERLKATKIYTKRVEAARARWDNEDASGNASASATQNSQPITHKTETKTKKERKRFTPPLFTDVVKRMIDPSLKNSLPQAEAEIEADTFINFYSSKGWKVGNSKMVSWESAVDGWLSRMARQAKAEEPFGFTIGDD